MMTKVSPVPATPAPTSLKSRVAPGIWRDQSVVLNCYTIAAPPAVSPGSSLFPAVLQSSTSQLAMDREGGRGEAAPHTGDVLTTDLSQIATQPWEQSGLWARGIRNATSPHNISYYLPDRVLRCNAV